MRRAILGICFLIFTTLVGVFGYSYSEKPFDVLISPNEKYKVELYGNKQRPWFFANTVTAKIFESGKYLASDEIHYGDWMDSSFDLTYQNYIWVEDNILSFRGTQNHQVAGGENGDSLLISNRSEKQIRLLKIRFGVNLFLIFDLPPNSSQRVYINHSKAPEDIYAEGKFSDGNKIASEGVIFTEASKRRIDGLFKYCVSVENGKVLINSSQIEGNKTFPNVVIPKSETCN